MSAEQNHVHLLDATTFRPFVESNRIVLVCFVMLPISGRSQRFVSEFEQIAYIMQGQGIAFAQVDALESNEIMEPFNITSFPRLLLFQGHEKFTGYRGIYGKSEIVPYLNRFLHFPVVTPISSASLPEFRKSNDVVVVAYIAAHDDKHTKLFESLAKSMHPEFVFGICNDADLASHEKITVPAIAVYRRDEKTSVMKIDSDTDAMLTSVRLSARPVISSLVVEVHRDLLHLGLDIAYIFVSNQDERTSVRTVLAPLARDLRQSMVFAIGDPNDLEDIVQDLHLQPHRIDPGFAIRERKPNLRYPMDGGHDEGNIPFEGAVQTHVRQYLGSMIQPMIKSEPIPSPSDEALVKVVGLTFQEIVMDNNKDVLLVYCIDHCGPCVRLKPILQSLARLYESDPVLREQVTVAIIDEELNDVEDPFIQAFPTIKLFPAFRKDHVARYLGYDELEALADFVRDEGTHKADLRLGGSKKAEQGVPVTA